MASKRIDELTNLTSLASDDLLVAYDISEPGAEKTKKITKTNAFNGLSVDGHTHESYLPLAGGNLSGDLTVGGNLTVTGTQFIANVQTVEVTDNLMLLNKNETGAGVTAGTAGLEIERGTATNYKFLFDEPTDTFRVGMEGSLQAVATRADAPTNSGIAFWNDALKRFDTSSLTPEDIGTGISYHGNEYHTVAFATVSGLTTTSGALQNQLDNLSLDSLYYSGNKTVQTRIGGFTVKNGSNGGDIYMSPNEITFYNTVTDGGFSFMGSTSGGIKYMLTGSPTGSLNLFHSGLQALYTTGAGIMLRGSAANVDFMEIQKRDSTATLLSQINGYPIYLRGMNDSGALRDMGVFDPDGASELYYAGVKKFETTNTGATITGDLVVTGGTVATQSYVDTVSGALNIAKANAIHTHDDRYYTESEVDTISGALNSAKLDLAGGNITGSLTVGGDFTVQGENFIANTQTVLVEDNLLVINKNEVGVGVTAGQAGIEVERGSETNYLFYFDETQDNFRVGVSGSLQAVATRQDAPTTSGVAFWNNSQTRFDTASGFTVNDIATKTYLSDVFSNKYEIFTTSGTTTVTTDFDLAEGAMGVYVDGVRQHNSAFTFSSPRTIILSDTVASGTAIAVIAMEADSVQAMSNKVNTVVSGTTNNLTKLTASGNIADAGVSAASVIEVVNTFSRKNFIINGNMNIWQRGTSFVPATGYCADRFRYTSNTDAVVTVSQVITGSLVAMSANYGFRAEVTTADASIANDQFTIIHTIIEGYDILPLIGKVCTLSFWAAATVTGTYCVSFRNLGGITDKSYIATYTINAANVWEFKTITFTMHDLASGTWDITSSVGLRIGWALACGSTYHAAATSSWVSTNSLAAAGQANNMGTIGNKFWLTGVQLELGSVATPFEFRPFAQELALCQRYYEKSYDYEWAPGTVDTAGMSMGSRCSGGSSINPRYAVRKRIAVTPVIYSPATGTSGQLRNYNAGADQAASVAFVGATAFNVASGSASVNDLLGCHWAANAEL